MDQLKGAFNSVAGGNEDDQVSGEPRSTSSSGSTSSGGGLLGGLGEKFTSLTGGGQESEKNEDYVDKGVDLAQEKVLGQGPQDNESAVEQAKDEQISEFIRDKYKSTTTSN